MDGRLRLPRSSPSTSSPTPVPATVTPAPVPASGHSFSATPVLQRQPAQEDPDLRRRRLAAAGAARTAIERLTRSLDQGYLLRGEVLESDGRINAISEARIETREVREARLRQLIRDLRSLVVVLDSGPVDATWFDPDLETTKVKYGVGGDNVWQDAAALYMHHQQAVGSSVEDAFNNVFSIQTEPIPTRVIRRAPIASGTPTGIYLIVPDAVNAPLVYRRLTQYEGWQERGEILEVWSDDFGYFYWAGESRKTYLPGRP